MNTFKWLIKRELWETRSAWMGPIVTAGVLMLIALAGLFYSINGSLSAEVLHDITTETHLGLDFAAMAGLELIAAAFFLVLQITQYSYLVDCLYSERKDRSVLFWKSLPVSDAQTVLAKFFFALLVMPAIAALATVATQVVIYLAASLKLGTVAGALGLLWSPSVWAQALVVAIYLYFKVVLWSLPLMAWVLLVSAFAPRSPMGLAILIPAVSALIENLLLGTHRIGAAVLNRLEPPSFSHGDPSAVTFTPGGMEIQTQNPPDLKIFEHPMQALQADLGALLSRPGLWVGLLVAAMFVFAAIEIRRRRDPSA